MIKLQIIGDAGKDATTQKIGEKNYAKFSLAVRIGKDKTQWVDCLKSDPEGKLTSYLSKGARLYCEGMPTAGAYIKDEKPIGTLTLWVNELAFLDKKPKESDGSDNSDLPY